MKEDMKYLSSSVWVISLTCFTVFVEHIYNNCYEKKEYKVRVERMTGYKL
jgi:hypothetical protein